jgi:ubiquinone/menaquinone biosynthesis C-methylase UbiE
MSSAESDSVATNVAQWTKTNADYTDAGAERWWLKETVTWGVFSIDDEWIGDVSGLDVVELGCGTAHFGARLARKGARVVGVDPTPAQLETARRMMATTGIEFPLVEAPAESVPLPDASFDLAVSDYGASLWADPRKWIPEAARLLRPGGRMLFLTTSSLAHLCTPEEDETPISSVRSSRRGRSNGRATRAWSITSRTAIGSASSPTTASCWTRCTSCSRAPLRRLTSTTT